MSHVGAMFLGIMGSRHNFIPNFLIISFASGLLFSWKAQGEEREHDQPSDTVLQCPDHTLG